VSMRVKGKIYRAIVLSTLLYGAEAWTVYRRQVKKLHAFMMRQLRSIMRITWMDKVTNKGRPRLRFKDTIKRNLKMRDVKIDSCTSLSQQRDKWRATVK